MVPIIYENKGSTQDPANYRPTSLTSVFRKLLEHCLKTALAGASPTLDIVQGGFRHSRSTLDQALWLHELVKLHRKAYKHAPILAFLDIKSAYDTVNRDLIWDALAPQAEPPLLKLLQNLFDEVT